MHLYNKMNLNNYKLKISKASLQAFDLVNQTT